MITEKQQRNIMKMPMDDVRQLLDICIDRLGVVDVQDAQQILAVGRSRVYQLMNEKTSIKIGRHKFIMINM